MPYFLSEERRAKLRESLLQEGVSEDKIDHMLDVEDDMDEVDAALSAHIATIDYFSLRKKAGDTEAEKEMLKGASVLLMFIEEATERGYGENDFPHALRSVCHSLRAHEKVH